MPRNDPMQDGIWTGTPGIGTDFEDMLFEEIEEGDLFWLEQNNRQSNQVYRKVSETEGQDLRTRQYHAFRQRHPVFQKT